MTLTESMGVRRPEVALGTAAFADYAGQPAVDRATARRILIDAAANQLAIDTARGYGFAERWIGEDVPPTCPSVIITKVVPSTFKLTTSQIDASRRALRRDVLDAVLLHSPNASDFASDGWEALTFAKLRGSVRRIGASVYTVGEADAAVRAGADVLQVPCSLIDQRFCPHFGRYAALGVEVHVRSVWARGLLAGTNGTWPPLAARARRRVSLGLFRRDLTDVAVQFACAQPVASVVVGVRSRDELSRAYEASLRPLGVFVAAVAPKLASDDERVYDIRRWP